MLFFTDPARVPDPCAAAERLPRGAGVVFRAFGMHDAVDTGMELQRIARRRGLVLLVGNDETLAATIGADGLHLSERRAPWAPRLRARRPLWMFTAAAHSARALNAAARAGVDAAVLSPVFDSRSPSAGAALGPGRAATLIGASALPVYALGGIGSVTVRRLRLTGAGGLAAVEALSRPG